MALTIRTALAWAAPDSTKANSDAASAESVDVVPPRALETNITSPEQPTAPVEVVLELVIDVKGHVTQSKAVAGPEPFRSVAEVASLKFMFAPALREGTPVASKVRFLVRFEPALEEEEKPKEPVAEPAPQARTERKQSSTKSTPGELEVTVPGTRTTVVSTRISRVEAREIPGTFGDPLRAVETNPGVVPMYTGIPFFFIRGAPPGSVGYYIDGVKIPLLYHALAGPSVVHPGLIDHVDIYRGAAPARYGGTAGATIAAESRAPLPTAGGEANLRVFDVGGLGEIPLLDGRLHVLAGGRYSYTALVASLLSGATLEYWDYQSRITYDFNERNRLTMTAFGAFDKFEADSNNDILNRNGQSSNNGTTGSSDSADANLYGGGLQFHRIDVREDYFGTRTRARFAVTAGYDRTSTRTGYLRSPMLSSRSFVEYRLTPELLVAAGHDSSIAEYSLDVPTTVAGFDVLRGMFPNRRDMSLGGHVEATWTPAPFVSLTPGGRADTYRSGDETESSFDGRMTAVFIGSRHIRAIETLGTSHQPPGFVPQIPAAQLGSLKGGLQSTLQFSSGLAVDIAGEMTATVTAFEAQYRNLIDPIGQNRSLDLASLDAQEILNLRTPGKALGLEFELRRALTHRLGGFISYTLSRNERTVGGRTSLSGYDRPHVFQGALGYDLGRQWRVGGRVIAYSGIAAKQLLSDNSGTYIYDGGHRAPTFVRLDLRLEKRWPISPRSYWAVVAEMLNATLAKEVTSLTCGARCRQDTSGPVSIPSIGLEFYSY